MLGSAGKAVAMEPSRVVLSRGAIPGQILTTNTSPPVDRETSAPLADIRFPTDTISTLPVFTPELSLAIEGLVSEWSNLDALRNFGIQPSLSCLLFGIPGTGKTKLAFHIADRLNVPMVVARLDGLISSFLGTTARNIANLFDFAARYQCILLLDEFDALAKLRDDPHEVGEIKRVVNTLLQCLDGRAGKGLTIAITNHEVLLDSAVWRRFDARISVPRPGIAERQAILSRYLPPLCLHEEEIRLLAWLTDKTSGAEIELLANSLKRYSALRQGQEFHLLDALKSYLLLNSGQGDEGRRQYVLGSTEDLAKMLRDNPEVNFNTEDLAKLFGKDRSTISRWLKKR
jgi:SpoVK/Ycf46/Vps4 family AAA+-type ATPase